jgi:hypothetical protein
MYMKILIFHTVGEEEAAERLSWVALGYGEAVLFAFPQSWETGISPTSSLLARVTHFLTFGESLPQWFPFVAGLALGKDCPFVFCGDFIGKKPSYAADIVVCENEVDLIHYLKQEATVTAGRKASDKARDTLLGMGIPVSTESFARNIHEGNMEAVRLFLDAGFSVDTKDKKGVPMLCIAARSGMPKMIEFFIAKKCDVNQKSNDRGNTALVDAALGKHANIVHDLISAGADVNAKSKDGQSAIIISVGLGDVATVELLLKAGANADEPDALGATARKYATLFHRTEILALFEKFASHE